MKHKKLGAAALLASALLSQAGSAGATTVYGSAAQLTARDCSTISASTDCTAGTPRVQNMYLGGLGASLDTGLTNSYGSWNATTGANLGGLPVLKAGTWSGASTRLNSNVVVFQQFTFTGAAHTLFSLVGDLTFSSSGNDGASLSDPGNSGAYGEQAGEGGIFAQMYFMDPAAFLGLSTPQDVMSLLGQDCSNPYMRAASVYSPSDVLAAGSQAAQLKISQNCAGNDIYLNPGDTAVLVMAIQTPSNRGGFVDATHTFVSAFDPALSADNLQALQAGFVPLSPADLPEPASAALALGALAALALVHRQTPAQRDRKPMAPPSSQEHQSVH